MPLETFTSTISWMCHCNERPPTHADIQYLAAWSLITLYRLWQKLRHSICCVPPFVFPVYTPGILFFFLGGVPQNLLFSLPQTAAKLCAVGVFYRPGRLDSELQIYHGNFLLAGNEHRKLFVTKQSKGCKFMSTSENAPKHVLRPGCARIRWGGALRSPRTPRHWRRRLLLREGRGEGLLIRGERKGEREGGGMDKACFPGSAETLVRWGNISVW